MLLKKSALRFANFKCGTLSSVARFPGAMTCWSNILGGPHANSKLLLCTLVLGEGREEERVLQTIPRGTCKGWQITSRWDVPYANGHRDPPDPQLGPSDRNVSPSVHNKLRLFMFYVCTAYRSIYLEGSLQVRKSLCLLSLPHTLARVYDAFSPCE